MFDKILIANRGEIALRILRACKELGIATVAVHSTADDDAMHVRLADESVCIGPPPAKDSYLNIPALLAACEITGADAVHPGYGFLSENARFAEILTEHNIHFIGPKPAHIRLMGDKIEAKRTVKRLGIPVVPGSDGAISSDQEAVSLARTIGFPVLIKAAAGGGGRGMKVAHGPDELAAALAAALAERVAEAMRGLEYLGVGTVEFLHEDGKFYFIEMNTRIQVEHPVTEMITDIDLVLEQIRVAAGGDLELAQRDVKFHGHAIECRINAESPVTFRPSPGRIVHYHTPGGLGVRVDSAVYHGYSIPAYYDSLVGKLIVHGKTRGECLMRLKRALDEFVVDGIETTLPLFRALVREKDIIDGDYHIRWLEQFLSDGGME